VQQTFTSLIIDRTPNMRSRGSVP